MQALHSRQQHLLLSRTWSLMIPSKPSRCNRPPSRPENCALTNMPSASVLACCITAVCDLQNFELLTQDEIRFLTRFVIIGQAKTTGQLLQSLAVFKACTIKPLVSNADTLLSASRSVAAPVVDYGVKHTFFRHFCGGECVESIQPTLQVCSQTLNSADDPLKEHRCC